MPGFPGKQKRGGGPSQGKPPPRPPWEAPGEPGSSSIPEQIEKLNEERKNDVVRICGAHRLADLQAQFDRELEWKPYEFTQNITQAEYTELAKCVDSGSARYMTDDEALDWICREFGFGREFDGI